CERYAECWDGHCQMRSDPPSGGNVAMTRRQYFGMGGALIAGMFVVGGILLNSGQFVPGGGGNSLFPNSYISTHSEFIDEWCLPATTASGGNYNEWQSSIVSTGVTQTGTNGTTSRPCIDEMQISTTAGSRAAWNW